MKDGRNKEEVKERVREDACARTDDSIGERGQGREHPGHTCIFFLVPCVPELTLFI